MTVIDQSTFKEIKPEIKLEPPDTPFTSPGGKLNCIGQFQVTTGYKQKQYSFPVYVLKGECSCLFGHSEAVEIGLVKRVDEIEGVYGSSGLLKTEPVKITLQEGAQPYAA